MKTIRWISFIPAFLIYATVVNALAQIVCLWLYNFIFPVNGILGYIGAGFYLMIILGLYMFFISFECIVLKICPKLFIGSRILLIIYGAPVLYFCITNFDRVTKVNLIFDIGIILTLILFCFKNEEDKKQDLVKKRREKQTEMLADRQKNFNKAMLEEENSKPLIKEESQKDWVEKLAKGLNKATLEEENSKPLTKEQKQKQWQKESLEAFNRAFEKEEKEKSNKDLTKEQKEKDLQERHLKAFNDAVLESCEENERYEEIFQKVRTAFLEKHFLTTLVGCSNDIHNEWQIQLQNIQKEFNEIKNK